MQWEEKWKIMMSDLGKDAKIPDLWGLSGLSETCPKKVKEQMMMRLGGIGENHEKLRKAREKAMEETEEKEYVKGRQKNGT